MKLSVPQIQEIIQINIPDGLVVPEHTDEGHLYRDVALNLVYPSVTTKSGILDMPHLKKWAVGLAVEYIDNNWNIITPENKDDIFKAARMAHEDFLGDAGYIGTQGHEVVERYLKSWMSTGRRPADITKFITGEDIRLYAISRSAQKFCEEFNVIPVASELFVMSQKYKYAGTLDSLMMVGRVLDKGSGSCANQPGLFGEAKRECDLYGYSSEKRSNERVCTLCGKKIVFEFALVDFKTSNSINKPEYAMQIAAYNRALFEMTGLKVKHLLIIQFDKEVAKYNVMRVVSVPEAFRAFVHCGKVYDWLHNGKEKLSPLKLKERIPLSML